MRREPSRQRGYLAATQALPHPTDPAVGASALLACAATAARSRRPASMLAPAGYSFPYLFDETQEAAKAYK